MAVAVAQPVVDADGHVLEHPDGMLHFAPAKFRERIWHIEVRADGSEWLHYNGSSRPAGGMALAGTAGMSSGRTQPGARRQDEVQRGAPRRFRAGAAPARHGRDGITQAVLYPTMLLGLPGIEDAEFAEAQANAYNEWLAEFCRFSPKRLFGVAVVPTQDVERAVRTIRRAKELGHVGDLHATEPGDRRAQAHRSALRSAVAGVCRSCRCRSACTRSWRRTCPARAAPSATREMRAAGVDYGKGSDADPVRNLGNIFFSQALANPFDMMECVALFCAGGILERFPGLTVLFLEANGGWIVSLLERLDHHFEVFRWDVPWLKMKPSEYFRRQCYISFDPDEIDPGVHRAASAGRRRPHHLGERLPASGRQVPGRRRRARRGDGVAHRARSAG